MNHHVCRLTRTVILGIRTYSTPTGIFRDTQAAELVAVVKPRNHRDTRVDENGNIEFPKLGGLPEVIVTGRANSGKSSLFNAVLGRKNLIATSKRAGRTRSLDFFRIGTAPGKLILVDAPGYGRRGRPEWGELFDHYVKSRQELRRILVTFNTKNGINGYDEEMLGLLCQNIIDDFTSRMTNSANPSRTRPLVQIQPIFTKADSLPNKQEAAQEIINEMKGKINNAVTEAVRNALEGSLGATPGSSETISKMMCLTPILTSAVINPPFGIDEVRKNIAGACGLTG